MMHIENSEINKKIVRFIKIENKKQDLSKIIKVIMQHSFSNITLSKLDKQSVLHGYDTAIIDDVSRIAIKELFDREINKFDKELITGAWKQAYQTGLTNMSKTLH